MLCLKAFRLVEVFNVLFQSEGPACYKVFCPTFVFRRETFNFWYTHRLFRGMANSFTNERFYRINRAISKKYKSSMNSRFIRQIIDRFRNNDRCHRLTKFASSQVKE